MVISSSLLDAPKPASPGSRASSTTSTSSCRAEVSCGQRVFGRILTSLPTKMGTWSKEINILPKKLQLKWSCKVEVRFWEFYPGDLWHSYRWPILRSFSNGTMVILRRLLQSLRRARIAITRWEIRRQQRSQDLISNHSSGTAGTAFFPQFRTLW